MEAAIERRSSSSAAGRPGSADNTAKSALQSGTTQESAKEPLRRRRGAGTNRRSCSSAAVCEAAAAHEFAATDLRDGSGHLEKPRRTGFSGSNSLDRPGWGGLSMVLHFARAWRIPKVLHTAEIDAATRRGLPRFRTPAVQEHLGQAPVFSHLRMFGIGDRSSTPRPDLRRRRRQPGSGPRRHDRGRRVSWLAWL